MSPHSHFTTRLGRAPAWLLALAVLAFVTACGSGDGGGRPFSMTTGGAACGAGGCGGDSGDGSGVGSGADGGDGAGGGLGEMRGVRVTARKPDGSVLASADLTNNLVSVYPGDYDGPFILEFADKGGGEYYDEGTQTWTLLNGTTLHVLVPRLTHHVSANPLTEAAYRWAVAKYGASNLDAARMTEANNLVRDAFNARTSAQYRVTDITNYSIAVSDLTAANSIPNTHAGRMSTLLAALPRAALRFGAPATEPALAFMRQLVKDLQDDDQVNASVSDADSVAYGDTLPEQLVAAIEEVRGQYGSPSQPAPATACFNPSLYVADTVTAASYDFFDGETTTPQSWNSTITGGATLGSSAGLLRETFDFGAGFPVENYYGPDLSQGVLQYGTKISFIGQDQTTWTQTTIYDTPVLDTTFLLGVDSSATVRYSGVQTTVNAAGQEVFPPQTLSFSRTVYFAGYEDVIVPAGLFRKACRYETTDNGQLSVSWFPNTGEGLPIRSESRDPSTGAVTSTLSLTSGSVNGRPVVGEQVNLRR